MPIELLWINIPMFLSILVGSALCLDSEQGGVEYMHCTEMSVVTTIYLASAHH